jgi:hypothetical protein
MNESFHTKVASEQMIKLSKKRTIFSGMNGRYMNKDFVLKLFLNKVMKIALKAFEIHKKEMEERR